VAHDAFISHSSSDKEIANQLIAVLEQHGITCWAAMRDALYGPTYAKQIVDAIRDCKLMVLLFSPAANDSPHILREVERAVDLRVPLITVRIANISPNDDLDYFLRVCHWMDAYNGPFDQYAQKLAGQVKAKLTAPAASAPSATSAAAPKAAPAIAARSAPVAAPAPVAEDAPAEAAAPETQVVAKKTPVAKLAAAAVLAVGVAAAAIVMMPRQAQSGWQASEHFMTLEEVKAQIAAEMHDGIASMPVTRAQFAGFVHARSYTTDAEHQGLPLNWRDPGFHQEDSDPVVCVDYNDAKLFCQWLGEYRLPTEAEWAAAAAKAGAPKDMNGKIWQWLDDSAAADAPKAVRGGGKVADQKMMLPATESMNNVGFRVAAGS
jgi:hypothetical protein